MERFRPSLRNTGYWTVVIVGLTELCWFLECHERRWERLLLECNESSQDCAEGLVIRWNGLGYYAWLRSLLIDHDWSFANEFDEHNPHHHYVPPNTFTTRLGRRTNQWSIGPACAWAPMVAPGHFALVNCGSHWKPTGYSLPYQLLVGGISLIYSLVGVGLLLRVCNTVSQPAAAGLATALLVLGTTGFYYGAIDVALPHNIGMAIMAGLVGYWLRTFGSCLPGRWFLVGVLIGMAALMRWQLATYAILPVSEAFYLAWTGSKGRKLAPGLVLCAGGAILAFCPQMVGWKCVYGSWLVVPIQGIDYHFLSPSLCEILFSKDRSLFYWTPIVFAAWVGSAASCVYGKAKVSGQAQAGSMSRAPYVILFMSFIIQVYALASIWGQGELVPHAGHFAGVYLARSFGFRDLTESVVVLAPGFAWWLNGLRRAMFVSALVIGLSLVGWNLTLVALYENDLIPALPSVGMLVENAKGLVNSDPWVALRVLEGPILLGLLLGFFGEVRSGLGDNNRSP